MFSRKGIISINIILAVFTVIGGLCYDTIAHNLVMKSCASLGFSLLGLINLLYGYRNNYGHRSFALIMVIGLFTGMIADIILEINFMMGALVFAVGHVFFIFAYARLSPLRAKDLIPGALIFALISALVLFLPIFDFGGSLMQIVCLVYAAIIGIMCGKAFSNRSALPGKLTNLLALGSILFLFSDTMLLFSNFADVPNIIGSLCVNSYYPAQVILAHALLYTKES